MTPEPPPLGPRRLTVLTTGRHDWGLLRSTCAALTRDGGLELDLVAGGMHLSEAHGSTIDEIRADGFEPLELAWLDAASVDDPDAQAGAALVAFGRHLSAAAPWAVLLVGDRFETAAAALAATLERVPIIHLHGGEQTLGAIDDALRHAITKLAHLHLVSNREHAARVIALGEDPAVVHVVGPTGLDSLARTDLPDRKELERELGVPLEPPVVLVTVQPETLSPNPLAAAEAVAATMRRVQATYVVTLPNVDPGGGAVRDILVPAAARAGGVAVAALGSRRYWGLLRCADVVLGNSSSGIIEAPAVGLEVINVGERQAGRVRTGRVTDVASETAAVVAELGAAIHRSIDRRSRPPGPPDRGWDARAGERAAHIILAWDPPRPPRKSPIVVRPEGREAS